MLFLSPMTFVIIKSRKKQLYKKRRGILNTQFKDFILSVASSLTIGYSIENSLKTAHKEMNILYGEDSMICGEIKNMIHQTQLNIPVESIFEEFASRSDVEDIQIFSAVFQIAKKGGGDLTKIIKSTADKISRKIEVKNEINTMISAKKFEQSIMNLIPMFIICYIGFASPELLKPLYGNAFGKIIMTLCLGFYAAAYFLSKKIIDIEV